MNIAKAYLSNDKDMIKFQYGDNKNYSVSWTIFVRKIYVCEKMG